MSNAGKYLENISLIYMSPCVADDTKIRFKAELSRDVSEMMPYLNTVIKNATYNPDAKTIFFTQGPRMIKLAAKELAVQRAADLTDAHKVMDFIKDTLNDTYADRDSITPSFDKKVRTTALEIFSFLPRTNCKACGEPSCLAFAVKLLLAEQSLSACEPLYTDDNFTEHKKQMVDIIDGMGLKL